MPCSVPTAPAKTTLIEILEGYRQRDAGDVSVLGFDPQRQRGELNRRVGIVLQRSTPMEGLTPREMLNFSARLYDNPMNTDDALELVGSDRTRRPPRLEALGRSEATARPRHQRDRQPGPDLPRRTNHRLRRHRPPTGLGGRPRTDRARRHRHPDHPLPRRGRAPRAEDRPDQGRPDHLRRRHRRPAAAKWRPRPASPGSRQTNST